jgi:hypothetical protein
MTLQRLFGVLLSGAILIVSVVTSISSIVLSQEITDIDTVQDEVAASVEFRRQTEDLTSVGSTPGRPAEFLTVILHAIHQHAAGLGRLARDTEERDVDDQIQSLVEDMVAQARRAGSSLDGARFGTFTVLSVGLRYDYSWQLNTAHRIRRQFAESLTDEEDEVLSEMIDVLKVFATGREYFQSLFYKYEVSRLTNVLLYTSLPVIVFISYLLLALDKTIILEVAFSSLSSLTVFILLAYTISLSPYVVLTTYILRIGTIASQTLAAGPFMPYRAEDEDRVEFGTDIDPDEWDESVYSDPGDEQFRD